MSRRRRDPATGDPPVLDLRLAIAAVSAWAAVLAALGATPRAVALAAVVVSSMGFTALLASRSAGARGRAAAAIAALTLFTCAAVLLPLAARLAHSRSSPLHALASRRADVTVELTVTADPRVLGAKGPAGAPRAAVDAEVHALVVAGRREAIDGSVLVLAPAASWRTLTPGQRVRVDARLQPALRGDLLSAVLLVDSDPVPIGAPPWWQRGAATVRSSLRTASGGLPEGPRGLLPGLIDGDTSTLDPVLAERFRVAGLTHLVAVSGTNCVIVIGAVLLVLKRCRVRPAWCAVGGAIVLVAFVLVARPSPSVLRAAAMSVITLVSLARGRPRAAVPALSAAVVVLLLWDPELAADAGFAMSVLATGALLLIAPGWVDALHARRVPPGVAELLAVAAAAHVVTAPIVVAISGRVSLVAIPANVLAEPVVAAATVLGFLAAVAAPLCMPLGSALAQLAGWPVRWLVTDAEFFGGMDGASVPWPSGLGGGVALLVTSALLWRCATRAGPRRILVAASVAAVVVQLPLRAVLGGWPATGWIFTACDVGQGDALVLRSGPHAGVVIDAGPDPVSVDRCLRDLGVTDVPLVVLSHFHLDHVAGLAGVFHDRRVGAVVGGLLPEPASGVALVRSVLGPQRLALQAGRAGDTFDAAAIHLDVLAPVVPLRGTSSDPNNSSLVVRATVGGRRILLTGDVEPEAQQTIMRAGTDLRADVLKVAHHGSSHFDPAFLAEVHAAVAVISAGVGNDYGHPSALLLDELSRLGVPVHRTDRDGDVAVVDRAGKLSMVLHGRSGSAMAERRAKAVDPGTSAGRVWMAVCPATPPTTRRLSTGPPRPTSWSSSGTRSCSSHAASARSPPQRAASIRPQR